MSMILIAILSVVVVMLSALGISFAWDYVVKTRQTKLDQETIRRLSRLKDWMLVALFFGASSLVYVNIQGVCLMATVPVMKILSVESKIGYLMVESATGVIGVLFSALVLALPLGYLAGIRPIFLGLWVSAAPLVLGVSLIVDNWADTSKPIIFLEAIEMTSLPILCCILAALGPRLRKRIEAQRTSPSFPQAL